ncbi:MASE1 domain-containing protein [Actinopolymorpha rutila]|uniref:Integral membrane sensor domain MASE1 n=1 Tax=Actinopolymorpha rutila TaxID=446787 RepID=A0A852ZEF3_9ACTN|nr:integral membrane sensor domain MASE1 [Actinopolymorpha rutila]
MDRYEGRLLRRPLLVVLLNLGLAAVLYGSAQIGLVIGLERGPISPFWPPTGIAVAAVLVLGAEMWPGILLGSGIVNVFTGPAATAVPTAAGTTLACLTAYWALRRIGFRVELDRLNDALALVFLAAFGAMLVSSTVGVALMLLSGQVSLGSAVPVWLTWWTGDVMGVLIVTPLLLTLIKLPWRRYRYVDSERLMEIALLMVGSVGIMLVGEKVLGVSFLAFPLLVLAAWRFQLPGAAPVGLLVSAVAIHAAVYGTGSFAGHDLLYKMLILQTFNGSIALTGLLLSVAITERNRTRVELERTCARLGDVIEHIDRAMRPDRASPLRHWAEEKQAAPKGRS